MSVHTALKHRRPTGVDGLRSGLRLSSTDDSRDSNFGKPSREGAGKWIRSAIGLACALGATVGLRGHFEHQVAGRPRTRDIKAEGVAAVLGQKVAVCEWALQEHRNRHACRLGTRSRGGLRRPGSLSGRRGWGRWPHGTRRAIPIV